MIINNLIPMEIEGGFIDDKIIKLKGVYFQWKLDIIYIKRNSTPFSQVGSNLQWIN